MRDRARSTLATGLERIVEYHERQDERYAARGRRRSPPPPASRSSSPPSSRSPIPTTRGHARSATPGRLCYSSATARSLRSSTSGATRAPRRPAWRRRVTAADAPAHRRRGPRGRGRRRALLSRSRDDDTGAASSPAAAPALATPLWSVRRVPRAGRRSRRRAAPPGRARHRRAGRPAPASSCRAGNRVLAAHDPDTPLIGASTQKLLVAAAALTIARSRLHVPDQGRSRRPRRPTDRSTGCTSSARGDPVLATSDYARVPPGARQVRTATSPPASSPSPTPSSPRA